MGIHIPSSALIKGAARSISNRLNVNNLFLISDSFCVYRFALIIFVLVLSPALPAEALTTVASAEVVAKAGALSF